MRKESSVTDYNYFGIYLIYVCKYIMCYNTLTNYRILQNNGQHFQEIRKRPDKIAENLSKSLKTNLMPSLGQGASLI